MRVSQKNTQTQEAPKKQNAHRKLEIIRAKRNHEKKLRDQAKAPEKPEKTEPVKDKVELSPRVTVRDKEKTVISDVGPNDPSDPATQEKLRTILRTGAFSFSDQERSVLGEILGDSETSDPKSKE